MTGTGVEANPNFLGSLRAQTTQAGVVSTAAVGWPGVTDFRALQLQCRLHRLYESGEAGLMTTNMLCCGSRRTGRQSATHDGYDARADAGVRRPLPSVTQVMDMSSNTGLCSAQSDTGICRVQSQPFRPSPQVNVTALRSEKLAARESPSKLPWAPAHGTASRKPG
jgi:hypothetical protein